MALMASLLVVFSQQPVAAQAPGNEPVVHFVIDVSGSMGEEGSVPGVTKLDDAKAAVETVVEALPDGVALGLRPYTSPSACGAQPANPAVPIALGNETELLDELDGLQPQGGTPTQLALQAGIDDVDAYNTTGVKRIVLLTDGASGCSTPSMCEVVQDNLDADIDFSLYTVGLSLTNEETIRDLECAAEASGGTYEDTDPEGLADAIAGAVSAGRYGLDREDFYGCQRYSCGYASDPVGTAYGNFFDSFTDLPAQAAAFGLDVQRHYNSQDDAVGVLGRGWRGSFAETAIDESGDVLVTLDAGREVLYVADGPGSWAQPDEFAGVLSETLDGSYRVTMPTGETWDFDPAGRLESKARSDGQTVSITRDGAGNPTVATSSMGPSVTFSYAGGRLTGVESSDGRFVEYGYDLAQNLASVIDPSDGETIIANDAEGRVDTITDPESLVLVDNQYNLRDQVISQVTPDSTTTFDYNYLARTTTVTTLETGEALVYLHDEFGRLIRITDPDGKFIQQGYGPGGWMTSGLSRLGGETVTSFDGAGNPLSVLDPTNGETTYSYDSLNRVTSVTTESTGTTTYVYPPTGVSRIPVQIIDANSKVTYQTVVNELVTEVTDPDGVTVKYWYNALRQPIETKDEYGNATKFGYDAAGRQNKVELPSGARTTTVYDNSGRPTLVTAADGGETATIYDNAGRVTSVEDPTGATTLYTYDDVTGLVETMTDPALRVTTYSYDTAGRLKRTTYNDASYIESDYGILSRVTAERDELFRETEYGHDEDGNVTSVEDPAGGTIETAHDEAGRVATITDAQDRVTTFNYDPDDGQLLSEVSPSGTTSYTYDSLGRQSSITDHRGGVTSTTYTDAGRVDLVTGPTGVTNHDYDNAGRLWKVTAPGSLTTTYEYNVNSEVKKVIEPGGNTTETTFDPVGRVATVKDPAGVITTNTWSQRGELLTTTASGAGIEEYHYNPDGTVAWVEDALDKRTTFGYDLRGRQILRTDPNGKVWSTSYNAAGEITSESDPLANIEWYTYDPAGRVATASDVTGRTLTNTWNPDGQLAGVVATDGFSSRSTSFTYDAAGRRSAASVDGRSWLYGYTAGGDLASITGSDGRNLGFAYDTAGRRTRMARPDGSGVTYAYDTAGRIDTITPTEVLGDSFTTRGSILDTNKWTANAPTLGTAGILNNTAVLGTPAGAVAAGMSAKVPTAANGTSTFSYQFESAATPATMRAYQRYLGANDSYRLEITSNSTTARVVRRLWGSELVLGTFTVPVDTNKHNVRFQVDGDWICAKVWNHGTSEPAAWSGCYNDWWLVGNGVPRIELGSVTGAANSVKIDDFSHRNPSAALTPLVDYGWNANSELTTETLAGGGTRSWTWLNGQNTKLQQAGIPGANRTTDLTYDSTGRIKTEATAGVTTTYGYDAASQLLSATPTSGPARSWQYDNLGRRTKEWVGSDWTMFHYNDASQLTKTQPSTGTHTDHAYDEAGRRLSDTTGASTSLYIYNPAGQFAGLVSPIGTQFRDYNADGSLTSLTNLGGSATGDFDIDWDPTSGLDELVSINGPAPSGSGTNTTTTFTRAPGAAWATAQNGATARPLPSDAHGSTLTSTASTTGRSTDYTPWGQPTAGADTMTPKLGYRGELHIGELLYLRARDYNPDTGQFTSTDPLPGVTGTTTLNAPYHYTNNNPLNLVDPTGLAPNDYAVRGLPADFSDALAEIARSHLRTVLDPRTTGYCGTVAFGLFPTVGADACVVDDGGAIHSMVVTFEGVSFGTASIAAGIFQSNAQYAEDLQGHSVCVSVSATFGADLSAEVCIGSSVRSPNRLSDLTNVYSVFAGAGLGVSTLPIDVVAVVANTQTRELWDYPQCWSEHERPRVLPTPRFDAPGPIHLPGPGDLLASCARNWLPF